MRLVFANVAGGMVLSLLIVFAPLFQATSEAQQVPCNLAQVAFCDTFDAPSPNGAGTRSGDLDGVVWGVSRATSDDNPGQSSNFHWNATQQSVCGGQTVAPERDVVICNGQLVESVTDGGAVTVLAMYPRQPFDFVGRTGTVVFDVGDDTQGPHAAWPAFAITDQPVPAPYQDAAGLANYARNSFGFSLANVCPDGGVGVDSMYTTSNYAFSAQSFSKLSCVRPPSQPGQLNHFEVRVSGSSVQIWASDAGSTATRQIASANIQMPLTRGLIWIEDVHYNANKFNNQGTHTFIWDNVGFDGPILPRDLGFDVLDATHDGSSGGNIGFMMRAPGLQLQVPNVHDLASASAALLEFNWTPHTLSDLTYSVNGNLPHLQPWLYGSAPTYRSMTIALPVPLSELHDGTNTVNIVSTDASGVSVANVDLILVGAGGIVGPNGGGGGGPPTMTPTPTVATTATPTATPTQQGQTTFSSSATTSPNSVAPGQPISIAATVTAPQSSGLIVDVEVYDPTFTRVFQQFWDNQSFQAGQSGTYTTSWQVPTNAAPGPYIVVIGAFTPQWTALHWNTAAGAFAVSPLPQATNTPTATPTSTTNTPTPTAMPTSTPPRATATASPQTTPSFTISAASVQPSTVNRGGSMTIAVPVTSASASAGLIYIQIQGPAGEVVNQTAIDNQSFGAGETRTFSTNWNVPADAATGRYTVKVGVFIPGWGTLYAWNDRAAQFTVN